MIGWTEATARPLVDEALLHDKVRLIANALGTPPPEIIEEIHDAGRLVAALCGSASQACRHRDAGVDIVIAQGGEGGGHTGDVGSMVLWPEVIDAVAPIPVLAAGASVRAVRWPPRLRWAPRVCGPDPCGSPWRRPTSPQADAELPGCDLAGHRAQPVLDRQAVPHAAQRLDRGVGPRRHS
ncbi:MAG: nitronate monooxygenase [Microthrixaceae bacterium]|nr:nitronate monooxygenase [Microthrixaceae bacterium]